MEEDSANWCRFALLIINEGGEVLRHLFLLECLTSIFTHYSSFWIQQLDDLESKLHTKGLWENLSERLRNSAQSSQHVLQNLLQLWTPRKYTHYTLMEDIDTLQKWKNDIENELVKNVSVGVKTTLNSWSSQIQQELDKLNLMYTILRRWDSTFLDYLLYAQGHLQVEMENYEQFPSTCVNKLNLLKCESRPEFQRVIQNLISELETTKSNCVAVLQSFEDKCKRLVQLWQHQAKGSELMVQFLTKIKAVFSTEGNAQSHIDSFYGKHYEELEGLFKAYEEKASKYESRSEISDLIGQLCIDLTRVHSFKNIKFKDSIYKIKKNTAPPNLTKKHLSKLDVILRTEDLKTIDNSLLMTLIRKIGLINFKFQEWDEDPPYCYTSISAYLLHLRFHRNKIVAHTAQGKIPSDSFDNLWKEAKEVICRIASRCGKDFETSIGKAIDQRKKCPLETGREDILRKRIVEWCRKDILTQLSARSPASSCYLDMLKSMQKEQANVIGSCKATKYMCGKCLYVSTNEDFKHHTCSVAPRRVKCNECRNEFSTAEFKEHRCIQAPRGYECDKCKEQVSTEEMFRNHRCPQDNTLHPVHPDVNLHPVLVGALYGTALGPIGTVVGGAIGGIIGALSGRR